MKILKIKGPLRSFLVQSEGNLAIRFLSLWITLAEFNYVSSIRFAQTARYLMLAEFNASLRFAYRTRNNNAIFFIVVKLYIL